MYTGKDTECTNGLAYGVVMHLLEDLQEKGRVLYVDNFTSPLLFEDLFKRGTYASVTVRVNRKHFPTAELDEAVVERGSMSFRHHGAMTAGKWRDKRDVYFLSTLYRDESEPVNRRAKEGETQTVNKPKIVTDYNQYMSGVDIADQLMVYYACGHRTLKWYKQVFWRLPKQAIQPILRLWTQELAYTLTGPVIASRMGQGCTPTDPTLDRLKGKHFAYYHEKWDRCVVCAYKRQTTNSKKRKDTKTNNYCPKCDVRVCHGQCFEKYHTLVKF